MKYHLFLTALLLISTPRINYAQEGIEMLNRGIEMKTSGGLIRVELVRPDIVRVRFTAQDAISDENVTNVCITHDEVPKFRVRTAIKDNIYTLTTDSLKLTVDIKTGSLTYYDRRTGRLLLQEHPENPRTAERIAIEHVTYDENSRRTVITADGEKEIRDVLRRDTLGTTWSFTQRWQLQADEALYGLGAHMEDYMNLRDKTLYLCQHNLKAMVPVINSTAGYGLLIDAGSEMVWKQGTIEIGAAQQLDYYFLKGATMDHTVAAYRWLTGRSPMMPRHLFGYIQSKERYTSSDELVQTLGRFRREHIPIDVIVQDWNYWENGRWGHMKMNPRFYPDKRALTDSIHAMNARLMISIWPTFSNSPQADDFARRGMMLKGTNAYDAFNPEARDLYWRYANEEFFSNGFDAWWCDASEPLDDDWTNCAPGYGYDSHQERWARNSKKLADALGHERSQLYSLYHSQGIYEHQRATSSAKRVVNLTRSSYAGQQRYGTITWNGDTHASWQAFAQMIPAGLNFMSTGCPYWTIDAGAFFTKKRSQWFWAGDYEAGVDDMGYRELYARMLQYATFLPLMRSHGTDTPREPWRFGKPGEPFYESVIGSIRLRYQLLPYTYSLVAQVTNNNFTITRPLAFDFPTDKKVFDLKDEFLFGHAFLVAPVTEPMYFRAGSVAIDESRKSRSVYLPKGTTWYDFWTNKCLKGGQTVEAEAPISRIPVYVRAGSILPLCNAPIEYAAQCEQAEWDILVYPGADGQFTVYEDSGDGYDCELGQSSTFLLKWNDKRHTLTIGPRRGDYQPSLASRKLNIKVAGTANVQTITYEGKIVKVNL